MTLLLGQLLLSICGIPAAYEAYRLKNAHYSTSFLWLWMLGELLSLGGALVEPLTNLAKLGLIGNYSLNIISIIIIMYFNNRRPKPIPRTRRPNA